MGSFFATASAFYKSSQLVDKHVRLLERQLTFDGPYGCATMPIANRLEIDSGKAQLEAARAGAGLKLPPPELVEPEQVRVLPKYHVLPRPLHPAVRAGPPENAQLRSFVDFCVQASGADVMRH